MTDRNAKNNNPTKNEFDLVEHTARQMKKEREIAESVAEVTKRLEAIAEQLRKTKERQKAAERDQRLIRPSVVTSKGALAAHVLLKAIGSPGGSVVIDLVDQMIAENDCPETQRVKELCGVSAVTVAELTYWLGIPISSMDETLEHLGNAPSHVENANVVVSDSNKDREGPT
jgi:hypothetical protein